MRNRENMENENPLLILGDVPTSKAKKTEGLTIEKVQWSNLTPKIFIPVGHTSKPLPAGIYTITYADGNYLFMAGETFVDDLISFPDSKSDEILNEIEAFWHKGEIFAKYGFLHRRGYLLYGPPGGGKTAIVQQIIQKIVGHEDIVIMCTNPRFLSAALKILREIEKDRKIVVIFEDIDSIIKSYGEDALLSYLDGEDQINKVLNIATTNYPDQLPERIRCRPRRFDRVIHIGFPNAAIRTVYFKQKLNITDEEIDTWVNATEDFSFAAMAELVISVKCLEHGFEESIEVLRGILKDTPKTDEFTKKMGFGA